MKKIFCLFSVLLFLTNLRAENTNENVGAWSDTVGELRGRLIVAHGEKFNGIEFLKVYVELQNVSDTLGSFQIEGFDYWKSLKCDLHDEAGNPPKPVGVATDVMGPSSTMTLNVPWDSSLRIGVTASGYSPFQQKGGWFIGLFNGDWGIGSDEKTDYFLDGTFHIDEPALHTIRNWGGTLKLPKVKILRD
jgi:hypothetical protein